ncbi:SH3 domain-containing protein [Mycena floridula]|nr:SH3 domain-containing protein [Mycena floridula]
MTVMSAQDALLAHVVSQIESNVQFLISQKYISAGDASGFLNTLSNVTTTPQAAPARTGFLNTISNAVTPGRRAAPPATKPAISQARAIWAYNEEGHDADDLSFSAGDVIEILEETNADWWLGRVNGKQALFPSSYVERIQAPAPAAAKAPAPARPAYKPFMAAHSSATAPPPPGVGTNSVGLQQDPGQEQKKSKYGKYGDTMAHSAAGGVGFGAGAAIGGGLVRAIF